MIVVLVELGLSPGLIGATVVYGDDCGLSRPSYYQHPPNSLLLSAY